MIWNKERVYSETQELEDDFKKLKVSFLSKLKADGKSADDLTTLISCLKARIRRYVYKSWKAIAALT